MYHIKKRKPLARIGMIVTSKLDVMKPRASYIFIREDEDGFVSIYNDNNINTILNKRRRLLRYFPYPFMVFIERYSASFLRKAGIKTSRISNQ